MTIDGVRLTLWDTLALTVGELMLNEDIDSILADCGIAESETKEVFKELKKYAAENGLTPHEQQEHAVGFITGLLTGLRHRSQP